LYFSARFELSKLSIFLFLVTDRIIYARIVIHNLTLISGWCGREARERAVYRAGVFR
jgi:hypothetical protein